MLDYLLQTADSAARLIVCERTGCWAVALRRELADAGTRVWETRTLPDCRDELVVSPASFVVLEMVGDIDRLIHFIALRRREFPAAQLAVVANRSQSGYEVVMREAGAVHFAASPRQMAPLAAIALRHLAQVPPPPQSLAERIWSSLPWGTETRR